VLIEYDGTRFAGYQRQAPERGPTVQGAIETAIGQVSHETLTVEAAGRTDAGVHAAGQVVSFRSAARLDARTWARALNAHLPRDVAARAAAPVVEEFHARYSARARSYRYQVVCDAAPAPLRERFALRVARALDVAAMGAAAALLLGEHDFGAFGSSPRDERGAVRGHCVRTMLAARCQREVSGVPGGATSDGAGGDVVVFDFTANAFLTGMVRRLVGTLLLVGDGRLTVGGFAAILAARAKTHPGAAVAARGLCLVGVTYPAGMVNWEKSE
jgi:tRNA pseudouridine38-40 synthase